MSEPPRRASSRVAVTGLGVVCALGHGADQFWAGARAGRGGFAKLSLFPTDGCLGEIAAEVPSPRPPAGLPAGERRRSSRAEAFCLEAAEQAVNRAGLTGPGSRDRFGVSLGTTAAGMLEAEDGWEASRSSGREWPPVSRLVRLPASTPADAVARHLRCAGPRLSNVTACASSALSIGFAADLIRRGDAPGMIAGGGDALCRMTFAGFNSLRLVDANPPRPFDTARRGLVLGEGAGILVLEDWEHAARRGAPILAEFLDYGASCDAHHPTAPHPEGRGAAAAMIEAMERSGLADRRIDHINLHGTGTELNDAAEARAILAVFGPERSARIPLTAGKSMFGHLLGGAGGIEAVTLVLTLLHQEIPPTLGWTTADPGWSPDVVAGSARPAKLEVGLSNSFGFGGTNCTLVFGRAS